MKATILVQRVFGFCFLAFGLNGFVHFIPHLGMRNAALEFFLGLAATGYMLPLLYMTQAAAGALLLVSFYVPLALAMLAPIVINILLFHVFLAPAGLPVALMLVSFEVSLAWSYRESFIPMLQPYAIPDHIDAIETEAAPEPSPHHPATV
jgi:putative oxidoreductase